MLVDSIKKQLFHFFKVVELTVAHAWWAVRLVAIDAEVAVLVGSNDSLAFQTFAGCGISVLNNHLTVLSTEELLDEESHLILLNGS